MNVSQVVKLELVVFTWQCVSYSLYGMHQLNVLNIVLNAQ